MLEVIGVGFPRTGTMSLKHALEQLGLGPSYHMIEVFQRPHHAALWHEAVEGRPDWEQIFAGFRSSTDAPGCLFWRELIEFYPDARCILTTRDSASWYESCANTIIPAMLNPDRSPDEEHRKVQLMARRLLVETLFRGVFDDRAREIEIFEEHNRAVRDTIPEDRLLIFDVAEGWAPLCQFLSLDVPDTPFPRANTREEFRERFRVE